MKSIFYYFQTSDIFEFNNILRNILNNPYQKLTFTAPPEAKTCSKSSILDMNFNRTLTRKLAYLLFLVSGRCFILPRTMPNDELGTNVMTWHTPESFSGG